jgi:predicted ATPase
MLSRLFIKGFKSIRASELPLKNFNVLIGANGAGKSNFIAFFKMLQTLVQKELQLHVARQGGVDSFLHYGRKETAVLSAHLYFGSNSYFFDLEPTVDNKFIFVKESLQFQGNAPINLGNSHLESLITKENNDNVANLIASQLENCAVYHFHDTSETAYIKRLHAINDNVKLRHDGSNLAAFLYKLKNTGPKHYEIIRQTIRQVALWGFSLKSLSRKSAQNPIRMDRKRYTQHGHNLDFLGRCPRLY